MLQNKVYLEPVQHKYFSYDTKKEYISWSRFMDSFTDKFDEEKISKSCAGKGKYIGMTQQQVREQWHGTRTTAADHGTKIHNALEHFNKTFTVMEGCEYLEPLIMSVFAEYKSYNKIYSEEVLFTEYKGYGIAGTCDKYFQVSSHKSSQFDLEDFKTNLSGPIKYYNEKTNKFFRYPIEHLADCSYNRYALQLSMYAYMAEQITGRKCRSLRIRYIPPEDKMQHIKLPVAYLKHEIEAMIEKYVEIQEANKILVITHENPTF